MVARFIGIMVVVGMMVGSALAVGSGEVKGDFLRPGREYSTSPFWVWNGWMTEELVRETLGDLAGQGVRQVFIHPRPGLMTPYLSEEWFELVGFSLAEGKRLGMNVWLYDENSYPSGFAGGHVPEEMPESRGRGLWLREEASQPQWGEMMVGVYRQTESGYEDVTEAVRGGAEAGAGPFVVAGLELAGQGAWYGGRSYVSLLEKGVTEKFLEVTLDPYKARFAGEFGGMLPGMFTDEPHLRPAGQLPWASDLAERFEERWGYDLMGHLPSLASETGDWRRVRHNYYQLLLELFAERWGRPYYEYCEAAGLEFTGHYWEHEWPNCTRSPDNMAMYAWEHRPGIDTLMNNYAEHTHAQFGNVRAVKEVSSVGNQLGRRTICEAFGASGWDMRFEDMKRIGDWLMVLGVDTINEHLSYATIAGGRKHDHPPSFSYHAPWWGAYHVVEGYLSRLAAVLAQGEEVNRALVLEPTSTAWMYQHAPGSGERLGAVGKGFFDFVCGLSKGQAEYDLGCEYIMERWGSVEGDKLRVGRRDYEVVVLGPGTENVNESTARLLEDFVAAGGEVICVGGAPEYVDGAASARMIRLAEKGNWRRVAPGEVVGKLAERAGDFRVEQAAGDGGVLFHQRRRLDDGQVVFLVNTSDSERARGVVRCAGGDVEHWAAETGEVGAWPFRRTAAGVEAKFELAPAGSLLLFVSQEAGEEYERPATERVAAEAVGDMEVERLGENVLVLDYVDVVAGGRSRERIYYHDASGFVFRQHGLGGNPWWRAVQFKDEIISRQFEPASGFEAVYRFVVEGAVPERIAVVVERGERHEIACNGERIEAGEEWWLDRAFSRIDVSGLVKEGENELRISARPMTVFHELQAAFVVGDFGVEARESGFAIVPAGRLEAGAWNGQEMPLYGGSVAYRQGFEAEEAGGRWYVEAGPWWGSVAEVRVNGESCGYLWHQPWRCEVTGQVKEGLNEVELVVTGTLKNVLGPHHGQIRRGTAWPAMFQEAPQVGPPGGSKYDTIGYGLFGEVRLVREVENPKH